MTCSCKLYSLRRGFGNGFPYCGKHVLVCVNQTDASNLVNGEIQDFQRKFQDLAEELKSLQGLVVLKNQHLAEKELDLRWFGIRGVVSSKKRQELSATAEHLRQKKEETERAIGIEKKNFARDVTQFISLLESDDRAKGNQFLEATMQMEEFNCKEQRFYQGS
ncbi:uncharacterized protein [Pocillopora verrucosa]|uniref:uncharacterized protein isoform X2 n=1 Tax=Pocillopora verrucosa TaxID=203993 RepID=UPI00333F9230